MTTEEVKALLVKLGVKAEEATEEIASRLEAYKEELDTETRRSVRKCWLCVTVLGFVAGIGTGSLI